MCAVICRKATVALLDANPCLFEHKNEDFVRFCQQEELNEQDELNERDELNELNEQDELKEQEKLNEQKS